MSMFAVDDDEKKMDSKKSLTGNISNKEIVQVVQHFKDTKPSDLDLQDKIDDLQFELDCYKENNIDVRKRITALRLLLDAFDMKRFPKTEDKKYLNNYFQKIKHLIS